MAGNTRITAPRKHGSDAGFDAGVSEQSIRNALDYARRLKAFGDDELLDAISDTSGATEEPVTLDMALSELPRMLQPRRTGMYRIPVLPKPEE